LSIPQLILQSQPRDKELCADSLTEVQLLLVLIEVLMGENGHNNP